MATALVGGFFLKEAIKSFLGKYWLQLVILAAVLGGLAYVDHRGFERAKEQDRARELERQAITQAVVQRVDADLAGKLSAIGAQLGGKLDTIDKEGTTVVQPIITREIERDPRLAAPGSCLSPGLLGAVNAARGYPAGELGGAPGSASPSSVPAAPASH